MTVGRERQLRGGLPRLAAVVRAGVPVVALALVLTSCANVPSAQEASDAVSRLREYDRWAWTAGIALLWGDVVLPVPQTTVIAALGILYGTLIGGLLGTFGLVTGGLLGYGLMRTAARRFLQRGFVHRSVERVETLFDRHGAWAIVLTRSFPYSVPEAIVFLAGLARMPMRKFIAALTIGSIPIAFAFAALGSGWSDRPIVVLVVSFVLPIVLLPVTLYLVQRRAS